MPTAKGHLLGEPVTVRRDTGCNSLIVKHSFAPYEKFTGRNLMVYQLERIEKCLHEAEFEISSPFFQGKLTEICIYNPLYDVCLRKVNSRQDVPDPSVDCSGQQSIPF